MSCCLHNLICPNIRHTFISQLFLSKEGITFIWVFGFLSDYQTLFWIQNTKYCLGKKERPDEKSGQETEVCKTEGSSWSNQFPFLQSTCQKWEVHPSMCFSSSLSAFRQDLAGQGERDHAPWLPRIPWPSCTVSAQEGLAEWMNEWPILSWISSAEDHPSKPEYTSKIIENSSIIIGVWIWNQKLFF